MSQVDNLEDICPDLVLGAISVAAAAAGLLIYMAIVAAGKRKKRDESSVMSILSESGLREFLNILGK